MKQTLNRMFALLLCAVMLLGMFPPVTVSAASGEYVYFDNSEMQWDAVYAHFKDTNRAHLETVKMTDTGNNLWQVEIPEGAEDVSFAPEGAETYSYWVIYSGRTYTQYSYKHDKVYLYISAAYLEANYPGMDSFEVNFRTTDLKWQTVTMSPVEGKTDLWYADVPENAIRDDLHFYGSGNDQYWSEGWPWEDQYNMYFATKYGKNGWGTYDANATYEDKLELTGEYVSFDNSEMKWDTVYAYFLDKDWDKIGSGFAMTKSGGNIWTVEIPVGAYVVRFGTKEYGAHGREFWISDLSDAQETPTLHTYKHGKVYLYMSSAYVEEHYSGMNSFTANFRTTDMEYHEVEMSAVKGKTDVWYADVPADAIMETLDVYGRGSNDSWGCGGLWDEQCNMYIATLYGKNDWGTYDANATYEDKQDLSGEYVYFDNSEVQWETVYAHFWDSNWENLGSSFKMTEGENDKWSIETPNGSGWVTFGPDPYSWNQSYKYEAGKTYTESYYKYSKIYYYRSPLYEEMNGDDYSNAKVNYQSAQSGYKTVELKPLKGKDNVWYASIEEDDVYLSSIGICHGDRQWGWGITPEKGTNMLLATQYGGIYWDKYDSDKTYTDEPAGQCGTKATWKFDADTGTLTISGSGAMEDYWGNAPWWNLAEQIKTVNIEKGITAIGDFAFYNLYNVTKVSIGSTVKSIGQSAFAYCNSLTSVRIPAALKTLEDLAFEGVSLKKITISDSNKYFCVSNNVLFNKSKTILYVGGSGHTSYTVPKTVDVIKPYAFNDPSLTKLTISEGVQEIGDGAFMNTAVKTVKLPKSLKKIGIAAFGPKLTSYTVASGSNYFSAKDGVLFNKAKTKLISCPVGRTGSYTVPSTVKALADYAFCGTQLTKVKLPTSVTKIPEGAFAGSGSLTSINLHSKITSIGNYAFNGCTALTSVTIPASVTNWGYHVFSWSGLKSVTFQYGAKNMGINTFYGCSKLAKAYLPETIDFANAASNYESPFFNSGTATTKGKTYLITHENSAAESYAKKNGMLFKAADHKNVDNKCAYCNKSMKLSAPKVTAENVASTGKIKLSWDESIVAQKYQVYRATSKSGDYKYIGATTKTSYTDKTAEAGTKYYYKVRAVDADGNKSSFSSAVSCMCDLARPEVSITRKSGNPRLTWEKVDGAAKYYIYRATSKNGEYKKIKGTTATSFTDTTAKAGTKYYYKVKAVHSNTDANSAYSSVKYITAK